jgi:hypothetical protein
MLRENNRIVNLSKDFLADYAVIVQIRIDGWP